MASSKAAFLLCLNLVLLSLVSATYCPQPTKSKPSPVTPKPSPSPSKGSCPKDTLKFGACADLLKGLAHVIVGTTPGSSCCTLIKGLTDLEAAVCLCTAIKANVLGVNLNVKVSLTALLNHCGKNVPKGFLCA